MSCGVLLVLLVDDVEELDLLHAETSGCAGRGSRLLSDVLWSVAAAGFGLWTLVGGAPRLESAGWAWRVLGLIGAIVTFAVLSVG